MICEKGDDQSEEKTTDTDGYCNDRPAFFRLRMLGQRNCRENDCGADIRQHDSNECYEHAKNRSVAVNRVSDRHNGRRGNDRRTDDDQRANGDRRTDHHRKTDHNDHAKAEHHNDEQCNDDSQRRNSVRAGALIT